MNILDIRVLIDKWNLALQTRDPMKVVELYADDAILIPTVSNIVRHNHEEIKDYFTKFLQKGPKFEIDEINIRMIDKLAVNSGTYTVTFDDDTLAKARFTFVYQNINQGWLIIEHHSSIMPE